MVGAATSTPLSRFPHVVAMSNAKEKSPGWLEVLMPKIMASLGKNFEETTYEVSGPDDSFFMSDIVCVNIKPRRDKAAPKEETIGVVVKRPPQVDFMQEFLKTDTQFHNEILFYRDVAEGSQDFPRCIYAEEKPPSDSVIALENIKQRGFELCPWKYDVPLEYTLAAMREIGRFHGRGYVMKERQREKFFGIVGQIQESRFENTGDNRFEILVNGTATRPIEYLRNQGYDKVFCDKAQAYLSNAYESVMMSCVTPDENFSTLCHGDFTLNNTLFKTGDGHLRAMFIDFAMMRYGSPIIDLSTFICLHCANQHKKDHIDKFLKTYHDSLKAYFVENNFEDHEMYSYQSLVEDYKIRGTFGYVIASFYVATIMGYAVQPMEDYFQLSIEESVKISLELGGDTITKLLADLMLDMRAYGCFDHIL